MIALPPVLRIFPLGEVVLFPDTLLPLHVFEPRYRQLVADALDDDRTIGMALIRGADGPVEPVAGSPRSSCRLRHRLRGTHRRARAARGRALDDRVRGMVRFRIRRELEVGDPYRVVEAQALYEARSRRSTCERGVTSFACWSDYAALSGRESPGRQAFEKLVTPRSHVLRRDRCLVEGLRLDDAIRIPTSSSRRIRKRTMPRTTIIERPSSSGSCSTMRPAQPMS